MFDNKVKIYNIPVGVPFVDCFVTGLMWRFADNPEIFTKTTIFLPSQQSINAIKEAFFNITKGKILLLPKMRIMGKLDDTEHMLLHNNPHSNFQILTSKKPIPSVIRLPALAQIVFSHRHLCDYITDYQSALSTAQNILDLLDLLYHHNATPDVLTALQIENYEPQWQKTLQIIEPIYHLWQDYLSSHGYCEPLIYQQILYAYLADYWKNNPSDNPVIIAGITNAPPVALPFLQSICGLPKGYIVLSGLDTYLTPDYRENLTPDHPQYAICSLVNHLNVSIDIIQNWDTSPHFLNQPVMLRSQLCSEIMRPSHTTEAWYTLNNRLSEQDIITATDNLKIITADNDRIEATIIALIIREHLEKPHQKIALVTENPELVMRVRNVLNRWHIKPTDSSGICLADTPQGLYIKLLCDVLLSNFSPVSILAVLKHPLSCGGLPVGEFKKQVYLFEYHILRGTVIKNGLQEYQDILNAYIHNLNPDSEKYTKKSDTYRIITDFLMYLQNRFVDILSLPQNVTVNDCLCVFKDLIAELTATDTQSIQETFLNDDTGKKCFDVLDTLINESHLIGTIPKETLYQYIQNALGQNSVQLAQAIQHTTNQNIEIWKTSDCCFRNADIVILGGLTEAIFPKSPKTGVWLSRLMRATLGFELPETHIGTDAFNFVQILANKKVFLTHATESNGSPTIPSRWLIRLENVLKGALKNKEYLKHIYDTPHKAWADMLDEGDTKAKPANRPNPKPSVAIRPMSISVTDAEKWIRDPYYIYGKYILKLNKLKDINQDLEAADKGTIIHHLLHQFTVATADGFKGKPHNIMRDLVNKTLDGLKNRPILYVFWKEKLQQMAVNFVDFEIDRRKTLKPILYEQKGTLPIDTSRGTFTLNARCDRIDIDAQSQAILVDYKTSSSSAATYQEVTAGFAPQLPLQAMMLKQGGFGKAYDISGAEYIILSNKIDVKTMKKSKDTDDEPLFTDLVDSIFAQFIQWIELFNDENTGYPSRRLPKFLKFTGDYDLLARVPEWSLTEDTDNNNDDDTTE